MRALGLVGLVLALVIVGLIAKKQMTSMAVAPAVPVVGDAPASAPVSQREQARQVQQQVKDALDAAARTRQMPDDN